MQEEYYKGEYIIRQGTIGDSFFILKEGEVMVTVVKETGQPAQRVRSLNKGAYFGEVALLRFNIVISFRMEPTFFVFLGKWA